MTYYGNTQAIMDVSNTASTSGTVDGNDQLDLIGSDPEQLPDQPSCIIHTSDEPPENNLITPKDDRSWQTLLNAAHVRKHAPLLEIAARLKKGQVPLVYYHKSCRSVFTMKRDLDTIEKKKTVKSNQMENIDAAVNLELRVLPNRSPTTSRIYNKLCIFCDRIKYKKKERTKEKLLQCVELRADKTLRVEAIKRGDFKILAVVSRV